MGYWFVKVYPKGDEDTGLEPGHREHVLTATGYEDEVEKLAFNLYADELAPGEVELEIQDGPTGEVITTLDGTNPWQDPDEATAERQQMGVDF